MSETAAPRRVKLRPAAPDGEVHALPLAGDGPLTIGREEGVDLVVRDLRVSRTHARLEPRGGTWWVVDTSSSGVFDERGRRIAELELRDGALVHLGAPDGPTLVVELDDEPDGYVRSTVLTIGRDPRCGLVLDGLVVSRRHAELRSDPEGFELVDLDSANGTFVNGERIAQRRMAGGDRVVIGHHDLTFDGTTLRTRPNERALALEATHLLVQAADGTVIVEDVDLTADTGTLTAVVGPTGAGKSTLLKSLTGTWPPAGGSVRVGGRDLYRCFDALQLEIGYVPQDDIVHPQLTIEEALTFGAQLRLPDETTPEERAAKVASVCEVLGLSDHVHKQVARLSGGQRKRVSVALELLTEPSLLYLDEPTSGLDPGYEQAIMALLRRLADDGRTVVVVTHSVASLDLCDQVIFLGTGGWVGYAGDPSGALAAFGVDDYPAVFRALEAPNPAPHASPAAPVATTPSDDLDAGISRHPTTTATQFRTLVRRNLSTLIADRRGLGVLAAAAVVPALLLSALVGTDALTPNSDEATASARTLIGGIIITVGVIGAANGLREIVKELPIYRRERAAGLRRGAYLASKVAVLGGLTALQAVIVVVVATAFAGGPASGNLLPGRAELVVDAALTGLVALLFGLVISAFVNTSEKALALIPVVFVALWLFSGTVSDLADKPVLRDSAYASPSNWGVAAAASTTDLLDLERCGSEVATQTEADRPPAPSDAAMTCDRRWSGGIGVWAWDLFVLVLLGGLAFVTADWALARKEPLPHLRRQHLVRRAVDRLTR